ncbi:MAG TPA: hypothetical protein VI968_04240 [archaeon]|nr:hypothetical protein [archaeon]
MDDVYIWDRRSIRLSFGDFLAITQAAYVPFNIISGGPAREYVDFEVPVSYRGPLLEHLKDNQIGYTKLLPVIQNGNLTVRPQDLHVV